MADPALQERVCMYSKTMTMEHAALMNKTVSSAIVILASAGATASQGAATTANAVLQHQYHDYIILCFCLIGAMGGGWCGSAIWPGKTPRESNIRWFTNTIMGALLAPYILWLLSQEYPRVFLYGGIHGLAVGGIMGLFVVSMIKLVAWGAPKIAIRMAKKRGWIGPEDTPPATQEIK